MILLSTRSDMFLKNVSTKLLMLKDFTSRVEIDVMPLFGAKKFHHRRNTPQKILFAIEIYQKLSVLHQGPIKIIFWKGFLQQQSVTAIR